MAATYNVGKQKFAQGEIDWVDDTDIRLMLVSAVTPNVDHTTVDAVTGAGATEAAGTGYARIGASGRILTFDDADDEYHLDADDATWENIDAGTVGGVIVYKGTLDPGDDGTNYPVAYISFSPVTTNGGDLTINWHADGLIKFV